MIRIFFYTAFLMCVTLNAQADIANNVPLSDAEEMQTLQFMGAVEGGSTQDVKDLLEINPNLLNHKDSSGWTALMHASSRGFINVVNVLLKKGADTSPASLERKDTALMLAATNGHVHIVNALLDAKADPDTTNYYDDTALMHAAYAGHLTVVQALLNRTTQKADVTKRNRASATALMMAAAQGHPFVVRELLERGAELNDQNVEGWTPLMMAADAGHTSTVAELLRTKESSISSLLRVSGTAKELADLKAPGLIKRNIHLNTRNNKGETALYCAARNGHKGIVKFLLQDGAADIADNQGLTPLMIAAINGHAGVAHTMRIYDINIHKKDSNGRTALMLAAMNGHADFVKALFQDLVVDGRSLETPKINLQKDNGMTALIMAVAQGHKEAAKILLEKGADQTIKDKDNLTAIDYAHKNEDAEMITLLEDHQNILKRFKRWFKNFAL